MSVSRRTHIPKPFGTTRVRLDFALLTATLHQNFLSFRKSNVVEMGSRITGHSPPGPGPGPGPGPALVQTKRRYQFVSVFFFPFVLIYFLNLDIVLYSG